VISLDAPLNFRKECDGIIFSSQSFYSSVDPSPYGNLAYLNYLGMGLKDMTTMPTPKQAFSYALLMI